VGATPAFPALGQSAAVPVTVTYKRVDGLEIKADVHGAGETVKPCVVYIHGGALIQGSRTGIPKLFLANVLAAGAALISIDYRLAPETKLPGIIGDLRDFWRWLHGEGARRFKLDRQRIAVAGGSAGGYLTLMAGFTLSPRPRALASFWGYGDITADWYAKPDSFYLRQPRVGEETARAAVGTTPLSEPPQGSQRGRFYLHTRQTGTWCQQVAGRDPVREKGWFRPYCPLWNVSASYPPVILIHGTADTDVPYEQSKLMADALRARGARHELVTVPDGTHGLGGMDAEAPRRAYQQAADYLMAHLGR